MASLLYRLGRWCFGRRGLVVAIWLLVLGLLGGAAAAFSGATTGEFRMPGTESQRAMDALRDRFPQSGGATGTIVIAAPQGAKLSPADVAPVVKKAAAIPGVAAALDPFQVRALSQDGRYALVTVQFVDELPDITDAQRAAYRDIARDAQGGTRVEVGGEVVREFHFDGATESIGVVVAALVLIITFGSLVAAGMTLVNALVGVGVGMAGLYALTGVVELNDATPVLALMLGLAVGIDYSLFITSRYRQYLLEGVPAREAAGRAIGTAGSAVVFAGATVVIALAGLSVVGVPFLTAMGLAAAATVAVAVLVALTLLPAVLAWTGTKILPRRHRAAGTAAPVKEGFGYRWGRLITRLRVPVLLAGVLALGALALPVTGMHLALPDAGTAAEDSSERKAYDMISEGFGPGFNGRLVTVVSAGDAGATRAAAQQATALIGGVRGVAAVAPPQFNQSGTTALVAVIPTTGPTDAATEDTVHAIRAKLTGVQGAEVSLTGTTAVGIDISAKLADALPVYLIIVVGLSVLLLMLVFRSLLVPLKAAAGFLLTVGSTFGITVAVFQDGRLANLVGVDTPGPLVSFLPIILIGILFGLAMDYEVFLVSKMREDYVHGDTARQATINGLGENARVVTAAALIMISVFAGFVFTSDPIIKSIGFALAVGVFIDAFVVRMTLVPAVMSLLGRAAWWLPRPLDRALPDLDIEGERLRHHLEASPSGEDSRAGVGR
ncbi:membrane protein [Sphaerisporangium siamense]|uniref:RND superfamily putative drug exporter n=1 Tax=Sphaerisporangium siamense TaxID=795645 RepID=A0A7W7DE25_9ACTN|nr:MMPL family transporter [Sphaerisporangium siamense]MBB4703683.1 RND superfamily putative drug exporter [Sphaerisporangium siamense]GII82155.1 membrane protein [Sphaerisporangium siamense]